MKNRLQTLLLAAGFGLASPALAETCQEGYDNFSLNERGNREYCARGTISGKPHRFRYERVPGKNSPATFVVEYKTNEGIWQGSVCQDGDGQEAPNGTLDSCQSFIGAPGDVAYDWERSVSATLQAAYDTVNTELQRLQNPRNQ